MEKITNYWTLPSEKQQGIANDAQEFESVEYVMPQQYHLQDALSLDTELAVCASELFISAVQDRAELGGGYGVQVIALDKLINKRCATLEEVEQWLEEKTPYVQGAPVWVPLPGFQSSKRETAMLMAISEE